MSNWLEPAWTREAIATARPEIGTVAVDVVAADAASVVVVGAAVGAAAGVKPKLGRLSTTVLAVLLVLTWALDELLAGADDELDEDSVVCASLRSALIDAVPPACGVAAVLAVACVDACDVAPACGAVGCVASAGLPAIGFAASPGSAADGVCSESPASVGVTCIDATWFAGENEPGFAGALA